MKPVRKDEIIWKKLEENILIFNPETGDLCRLNKTATRIWELLDGNRTTKNIIDIICSEFKNAETNRVKNGLSKFLKDLENRMLIDWK